MITIADYSEFQGEVHPSGNQVVIVRAHNGWRADAYFARNRADAQTAGCPAVGIYQYLAAGRDPAAQAVDLLRTIGRLSSNEWLICDLEEGAGDQQARWQQWRQTVMTATNRPPWLYSGQAFAAAHDLDPDWLANYRGSEPAAPAHRLWQNSDTYPWPWGKGDASVFDGSLPEFLAAAGIDLPPVTPAPKEPDMPASHVLRDPTTGGLWVAMPDGGIANYDGAPFLGGTNHPQFGTAGFPCIGIVEYIDQHGGGYELVHDWGDPNGTGHSADGGDRFRRYRFPRDGSAIVK
jgi:hypothetical protein